MSSADYPIRLQELINQNPDRFWNLQHFIDNPPGEGMAVIYAEVFPSNKMYVGMHCHGKQGKSYSQTRMFNHNNSPACKNAYMKYGTDNVRVFIIDHCRAGKRDDILPSPDDSNGLEQFYISDKGLDTLSPNGYNIQIGGCGGPMHPDTIAKMKIIQNDPVIKEKKSKSLKAAMSTVEYRGKRANNSKKMWENENYRQKHAKSMKAVMSTVEYREKVSNNSKNMWKNEEYRQKHAEAMKISKANAEYRQRQSEASKKMWEDEDYRQKNAESTKKAWADPVSKEQRCKRIKRALSQPDTKQKQVDGIKKAKRKRMNDVLLPAIRLAFKTLWNDYRNLNVTKGKKRIKIHGRDMGCLCHQIRSRFDYVRHCSELAVFLKERGFKMDTRDEVKNAQKWAELEQLSS